MAATRPWMHVLRRPAKDGLGNAYRAGFAWALARDYRAIAQLDADLSHPPAMVPRMLEALDRGADLVLGSRYAAGGGSDGWPLHRRVASRIGCASSARALGLPYSDLSGGLKLWRASALAAIDVASTGRRATCSRSRRPSARTAPACASSSCRSRSATARRRVQDEGVDRARGRAHGRPPAPRRLEPSARGVGRAHRRVVVVGHRVEALERAQGERRATRG